MQVNSDNLSDVEYDNKEKILKVTFHSGAIYHYPNVSPAELSGLLNAKSIGSHLLKQVQVKHPGIKITGSRTSFRHPGIRGKLHGDKA